jgi:hypothetical protein
MHLKTIFKVIKGSIDYYVGFRIMIYSLNHSIFINQSHHITNIIKHFGMDHANPIATPFNSNMLFNAQVGPTNKAVDQFSYKETTGSLMYTMTMTQLNIMYDVSMAVQYNV